MKSAEICWVALTATIFGGYDTCKMILLEPIKHIKTMCHCTLKMIHSEVQFIYP